MKTTIDISGFDDYRNVLDDTLSRLHRDGIVSRIRARDYTVWKPVPDEIVNRLGWIDTPNMMRDHVHRMQKLVTDVSSEGYTHALVLGMGGSSLAPEVFRKIFGVRNTYLDLSILDSTDPAAILYRTSRLSLSRTLIIVATKSGTTAETISFFKFFLSIMCNTVGHREAGRHFIAITDPGSELARLAEKHSFRATFLNPPDIGGRYSALSFFGLVPAALIGIDIPFILNRSFEAAQNFEEKNVISGNNNPGAYLGGIIGALGLAGRDKLTFLISPQIKAFGNWVEQLIAESLGKEGRGILPVVDESPGTPEVYGTDRLFVYIHLGWDSSLNERVRSIQKAGYPLITVEVQDLYEIGAQFFIWEAATAVIGHLMGINPFDQPNVEAAKRLAGEMIFDYVETGRLPAEQPGQTDDVVTLFGTAYGATPIDTLKSFLEGADPGAYIGLQAYLQPKAEHDESLAQLRTAIRDRYRRATTLGYGPRYLHSTGQLHKGDAGKGHFIQFTTDDLQDVPIPDSTNGLSSSVTFGILKQAQALGDRRALQNAGRKVLRVHLGKDIIGGLTHLIEGLR